MNTFIALLRGINVGGHKKILMSDLRELFEAIGFKNAQTYIQSGNVIYCSEASAKEGESLIFNAILKQYGWDVPVIVKTSSEMEEILENCPFSEAKKENSYFTLLSEAPAKDMIEKVQSLSYSKEEFIITDNCIYFYAENYGRTKFKNNFFERKLKVKTTARNYRTMVKLISLSS
jgi:uncharacterized protein (DUF1697 family)